MQINLAMEEKRFNVYEHPTYREEEMLKRSTDFYQWLDSRRTVREFSTETFPVEVIHQIIRAANTAPSGAHKQPWHFCVISDPAIKKKIREAAENEERENYERRMSDKWLEDLKPLGTDANKPFLEEAPYLIVVMKKAYGLSKSGERDTHYYVNESVGIASGMLLAAIHHAGLVAVTHTPSPMMFLKRILGRPKNEQPFLLIPVGKIKEGTTVPDLKRKDLNEITSFY
jgi:nitroreductase